MVSMAGSALAFVAVNHKCAPSPCGVHSHTGRVLGTQTPLGTKLASVQVAKCPTARQQTSLAMGLNDWVGQACLATGLGLALGVAAPATENNPLSEIDSGLRANNPAIERQTMRDATRVSVEQPQTINDRSFMPYLSRMRSPESASVVDVILKNAYGVEQETQIEHDRAIHSAQLIDGGTLLITDGSRCVTHIDLTSGLETTTRFPVQVDHISKDDASQLILIENAQGYHLFRQQQALPLPVAKAAIQEVVLTNNQMGLWVLSQNNEVIRFDPQTLEPMARLALEDEHVSLPDAGWPDQSLTPKQRLFFSDTSPYAAILANEQTLLHVNIYSGEYTRIQFQQPIDDLALTTDGQLVIAVDGEVGYFSQKQGLERIGEQVLGSTRIQHVDINNDNQMLLIDNQGEVLIYDTEKGVITHQIDQRTDPNFDPDQSVPLKTRFLSPDSSRVISSLNEKRLAVYQLSEHGIQSI